MSRVYRVACIREVACELAIEASSESEAIEIARNTIDFSDYSPEYSFDSDGDYEELEDMDEDELEEVIRK